MNNTTNTDMTTKTDAELHYIARDAARAAEALDTAGARFEAEANRYRDESLEATSELRRRGWRPEVRS